ncbi:hypothetical protein SVAN01_11356 [Stagonosporopsis vannaccii]|nr:hypothetical protein SVAN01_11356 [Stagonosporopsis vannaccii]
MSGNKQWRLEILLWARNPRFLGQKRLHRNCTSTDESMHPRVRHSVEHRGQNGAARYPTPDPLSCDARETAQNIDRDSYYWPTSRKAWMTPEVGPHNGALPEAKPGRHPCTDAFAVTRITINVAQSSPGC